MRVVAPRASRPYMPGYGIVPPDGGRGLLPWSWAEERLARSTEYWVATVGADRPHLTPVWGVWQDGAVWFSCSPDSRKARHLALNPACTVATSDPHEPVVVEGRADAVGDPAAVAAFAAWADGKYGTSYGVGFYAANACFRVRAARVIGLDDADFTGTPTRWLFAPPA